MSEKQATSPVKYFLSGGFGGICTVVAGHPLDTIKVSASKYSLNTCMYTSPSKNVENLGSPHNFFSC
jgi:hypothetical protein